MIPEKKTTDLYICITIKFKKGVISKQRMSIMSECIILDQFPTSKETLFGILSDNQQEAFLDIGTTLKNTNPFMSNGRPIWEVKIDIDLITMAFLKLLELYGYDCEIKSEKTILIWVKSF